MEKYKYKRTRLVEKLIQPKLFSMIFVIDNKRYLKTAVAFDLEEATKKVTIAVQSGGYYTNLLTSLTHHTSLSIDEINSGFKNA